MIPLHKLKKLPRSQRLRKAAKIFGEAEARLAASGQIYMEEAEYLAGLMEILKGEEWPVTAFMAVLENAHECFTAVSSSPSCAVDKKWIRRAINDVYHLLLAETGRFSADWDFIESGGALDQSKRHSFRGMQVYLEDIRSPFNVGAMFRAAESFGAEKIWLSPLCADPRHKRAERTAMGCVDLLPWERLNFDPFSGSEVSGLKKNAPAGSPFPEGPIFAMETGGVPLAEFPFPSQGILVAGAEELGVSPHALAAADASLGRVSIPSYGAKGSLNVSVAFGIVMQAWSSCCVNFTM